MNQMINTGTISSRAMLVRLTISAWGGKALDRTVTAEVARNHNVSQDVGRYNKVLVPKEALEPISKAVSALRQFHYERTLPWLDEGARILPAAGFFAYRQEVAKLKDDFDNAVAAFVAKFPAIKDEAKVRLNTMYREADYPTDVGRLFSVRVGTMPMPDAQDFRVDLGDEVTERLRSEIESDVKAAAQNAVADCWKRIADVVGRMAERLSAYRINPETDKVEGVFRDSLVTNVRELVAILPALNFTGNSALAEITTKLEKLCQHEPEVLRNHEGKRMETIAAAESILADLEGYCS